MKKIKKHVTEEDKDLFRSAVKDVKLIEQDKTIPPLPPSKRKILKFQHCYPEKDFRYTGQILLEKLSPSEWVSSENSIHFSQNQISFRQIKKLKSGNLSIDLKLDLHGLSGDEAIKALYQCFSRCRSQNARVLLIIHGKSHAEDQHGPILKNVVYQWLKNHTEVLALQSAHSKHGGSGAVYVLLKRQKFNRDE